VRKYIPTPEIESSLRWWCAQQRYEKDNRWLHQTLLKAYGFVQGLKQQESIRAATFCGMVHRVADQMEDGIIIPTGIEGLDASIQGFGLGELCYLAARPGNCKTSAALECLDAASASGFPGLFLSMEMSQRPIGRRVLTRMGYDTESVQKMNMEQVHWEIDRYYEARSPLYFLEDVRDLKGICDTVREYVTRKGVKLVVLDHQGCIQTGISNEYDSISKAVEALANLKRELDIAVLVLAHLNREFDSERGRPKMRHLRGSGALENWADMILAGRWMFTEAPDIESNKERYIFHVLKCRNREAKNPDVDAKFMGYRQKFS
jgi:replicative DNA helicase